MYDLSQKEKIKIMFIRPPRYYWPIVNESDNFLLPLAYPTLAAYLRENFDNLDIMIYDCCARQTGWKSLNKIISEFKPDIVCAGEKTCYAHEANRAFKLVKENNPKIITIAGGQFFSHVAEPSLQQNRSIDFIIRMEGEQPLKQLIDAFTGKSTLEQVDNLVYRDKEGKIIQNNIGPNVDMTTLPMPAYDLAELNLYSPFGLLWPRASTIQRSRGCVDNCNFCSWIALESSFSSDNGIIKRTPQLRSKSPEQMIDEVEILYEKHGVRYLFWVDATWNTDDNWLNIFCEEIIRRKYKLGWWAFFRLDLAIEQHKSGTLRKMVKAGLRHILTGVERSDSGDLADLGKHSYSYNVAKESMEILRIHHPEVFRQGTFITGLRNDTAESIKALVGFAHDINVDFAAFHPLTPYPGTPLYEEALSKGWIEEKDFSKYDMFCPIISTEHLTRAEVSYWTHWCQKQFVQKKPFRYFGRLFSTRPIRRRLHWWFLFSIGRLLAHQVYRHVKGEEHFEGFAGVNRLWKPDWYDE